MKFGQFFPPFSKLLPQLRLVLSLLSLLIRVLALLILRLRLRNGLLWSWLFLMRFYLLLGRLPLAGNNIQLARRFIRYNRLLLSRAPTNIEDLIEIIEVSIGHLVINIPHVLQYLVDGLGIGGEDSSHFGVDFLQVGHVDLVEFGIPVSVPIVPFLLPLLRVFDLTLPQVVVQLVNCLALKDLQEFLDKIDNPMGDCPQIQLI